MLGFWLLGVIIVFVMLFILFVICAHDFGDVLKLKNLECVKWFLGMINWEELNVDIE